jgi:hypothetical protein
MEKTLVVVEKNRHQQLLEWVLEPHVLSAIDFWVAGSRYSVIALSVSLHVVRQQPVVMVYETLTTDEPSIVDERDFLIGRFRPNLAPYKVLTVVPELDVLLVSNKELTQALIGRTLTDLEWKYALQAPKNFLADTIGESVDWYTNFADLLQQPNLLTLARQNTIVHDITQFVQQNSLQPQS